MLSLLLCRPILQRAEAAATRAETAQQQTESASTDALDKISSAKTDALKA